MKKFFFVAAIAAFAACNNSGTETKAADSTATKAADTAKMAADSSKMAADTSKMMVDSTKKDTTTKK